MSESHTTQYRLSEPLDRPSGLLTVEEVNALILQGCVFGTDWIQAGASAPTHLQGLEEFHPALYQAIGHEVQGAWSGQLHPVQLTEVMGYVFNNKLSGYLIVRTDENIQKSISFRSGYPINAFSNVIGEDLRSFLAKKNILVDDNFNRILETQRNQGVDFDSAVNSLGFDLTGIKKSLSILVISRIINLFSLKTGVWNFIRSEQVLSDEVLTNVDLKNLIQTALSVSIDVNEATACLAPYGDQQFYLDPSISQGFSLDEIDQKAFSLFGQSLTLRQMIPKFEEGLSVQPQEARVRLIILQKLGVIQMGQAPAEAAQAAATPLAQGDASPLLDELKAHLDALKAQSYFDVLKVRRVIRDGEIEEALKAALIEHKTQPEASDDQLVTEQRARIKEFLEKIASTLKDEDERDLYERAQKLGQSLDDPELRARLRFDQLESKGRSFIAQQRYDDAHKAFQEASEIQPKQANIHLSVGWACFLNSEQDEDDAEKAMESVNRAIEIAPELDQAYLTAGKIYRLSGDKNKSERNLRRAISLNSHNNEAHSELRLLFSRELSKPKILKKKKKKKATKKATKKTSKKGAVVEEESRVSPIGIFGLSAVLFLMLFGVGNFVSGGLDLLPDVEYEKTENLGSNAAEREFLSGTRERFQTSEEDRKIPPEKQVIGNAEYYYYLDDSWWWTRRITLLIFGLLGFFLINRDRLEDIKWLGSAPQYFLYAIPYGLIIGFASGVPQVAASTALLLLMAFIHVASEQIFFIVFAGRGLLRSFSDPKASIAAIALLYGLYQFTFFATIDQAPLDLVRAVLQVTIFVGAAHALLLFKSGKGIVPPFVSHFLIYFVMMTRTFFN